MIEAYFATYNILQPEEIAHLARLFRPKKLAKLDFFAQPGKPCREVALVISGLAVSLRLPCNEQNNNFIRRYQTR
jgi:hypothetical protein